MFGPAVRTWTVTFLACLALLRPDPAPADPVAVRFQEGLVHGFLVLRNAEGKFVANGDLVQAAHGDRVTSRLTFRFRDGSLQDETAVFTQHQRFQLLTDRLVQRGPSFPQPLEMWIDREAGQVKVNYTEDDGEQKQVVEKMDLPADLANGMVSTLLKNVHPGSLPLSLPMVVATPRPRLVKLAVTSAGEEPFSTGNAGRKATHYVVKIEIGGVAGILAPLLGKQPPDSHVWVLGGNAPAFVKSEGPSFLGGPIWRIELTSPVWSRTANEKK